LEGKTTLNKHLNQVIKDLVLSVLDLTLILDLCHTLNVIALVELFEFFEGDDAVTV